MPETFLIRPPAWRGTLVPKDNRDLWLAAAFADYEKIVALERALKDKDGKLTKAGQARIDLALFANREKYRSAVRRLGKDVSVRAVDDDMANSERFDIAAGKGVLFLHAIRSENPLQMDAFFDQFGRAHAGEPATTVEFLAGAREAYVANTVDRQKSLEEFDRLAAKWVDGTGLPSQDGGDWSIDAFDTEPDQALVVYGTLRDASAQKEAAGILQDRIARRWGNYSVTIKPDTELTDEELKSHHILLIGRPSTNRIASRFASDLPVAFGPASFRVGEATYAHEGTAIVAAGANPLASSRFSLVIFAGLSADSTRASVGKLFERGSSATPAVILPFGREARSILLPVKAKTTNVADRQE
jgi:hypothetical protein